jgi:hypothetical protein
MKYSFLPRFFAGLLAACLLFSLTACGSQEDGTQQTAPAPEEFTASSYGEGQTTFSLEVTDADGQTAAYTIHTEESTVGAALLALGIIEGESSEFGLYVKTVCGKTLDYEADGLYWAFYVDGEYASAGVDRTEIQSGSTYAFYAES